MSRYRLPIRHHGLNGEYLFLLFLPAVLKGERVNNRVVIARVTGAILIQIRQVQISVGTPFVPIVRRRTLVMSRNRRFQALICKKRFATFDALYVALEKFEGLYHIKETEVGKRLARTLKKKFGLFKCWRPFLKRVSCPFVAAISFDATLPAFHKIVHRHVTHLLVPIFDNLLALHDNAQPHTPLESKLNHPPAALLDHRKLARAFQFPLILLLFALLL
mmetsp:Transcript_1337/g.2192  ORF Transcript_1337/g.2192 Transcript_1337/m.2192 type:complete len:219 (-) Transcript_1337:187-843(-)